MVRGERTEQAELGALLLVRLMGHMRALSKNWHRAHAK